MTTKLTADEIAAKLGDFALPEKVAARSPLEERIITGFEEIQEFSTKQGRAPSSDPNRDILERILATRLKALRRNKSVHELLKPMDATGLLTATETDSEVNPSSLSPDELAAALGGSQPGTDITNLRHVQPYETRQAPDEVATRKPSPDFHLYKDMFKQVQAEIENGQRSTKRVVSTTELVTGGLYIVEGQIAFIADLGEQFINHNGHKDSRLRVIYDNGTESNLLLRSMQKALSQDPAGRVILDTANQKLFGNEATKDDQASGTIYVLKSKSDHPAIAEHRDVLHKIGVTTGSVQRRIANASKDPTFLMADVEIVAIYELYNINRSRLENLLHRLFAPGQLKIDITDRFGVPINPREWFLVPDFVIHEAVERIKDGSIVNYYYDSHTALLRKHDSGTV